MLESVFLFIIMLIFTALGTIKMLHMFQLNSYKPKEQIKWYKKNISKLLPFYAAFVGLSALTIIDRWYGAFLVFVFSYSLNPFEKAKKPLVYTPRVKRLLVTCTIVFAVFAVAVFVVPSSRIKLLIAAVEMGFIPLTLLLCNYINKPVELSINKHYINDAKRMLAACPKLKIIGVTGSFGKTSVKFYLNTLLRAKYNVLMTPESYNTPMGIVKTIRGKLKATHEIFICEMGARNVGDIKEICDIVHPDHGVITSIGEQHLETFKTVDNIINTKFELADSLNDKGILFVNGDCEAITTNKHKKMENAVTYGLGENCAYRACNLKISEKGSEFTVVAPNGEKCDFVTKLIGTHNVINIVGAIAVSNTLSIPLEKLKPQVRKLECVPHRLQLINRSEVIVVDDAYNSNPSGAKAALDTISYFDGMKILVTPGMVELGEKQEELNYNFGRQAANVCDCIILVGERQTKPIYNGVKDAGYDMTKCYVAKDLKDAVDYAYGLKTDKKKIMLLENDLPDNY